MIGSGVTNIGNAAFSWCFSLSSITIPANVTSVGDEAFSWCPGLTSVYFQGNIPNVGANVFDAADNVTVYSLPGTTGWNATFGGRPVVLWNPQVQKDTGFGVQTNGFGFTIIGSSNLTVIVEVCTNLTNPVWIPLGTNTLTDGLARFRDSDWTNYSARFYRLRTP